MMNKGLLLLLVLSVARPGLSQVAGNTIYGSPKTRTSGVTTGNLSSVDPKDSSQNYFVEANVLMNVRADEYVAIFALAQEGPTLRDANEKIGTQVNEFLGSLEKLGVKTNEVFIDFISQNRVYDFVVADNSAKETQTGFEVKKNVAVRYKGQAMLDELLAAAAKAGIFDLVKVDYVISDMGAQRERLLNEASKVIRKKEADYNRLFGAKKRRLEVYQEKYNAFFPSEMYSSYAAFETGEVYRGNLPVVTKRKTRTSHYDPLDPAEFDLIIGRTDGEPMVQLTLYLKMKVRGR
jgi:Uncharacterized conserved protein